MNLSLFYRSKCLLIAAGLLMATAQFCHARDASQLSGSYAVLQTLNVGSQTRVRVRMRLTNHGQHVLRFQRLTLQDFSHSVRRGSQACAMVIPSQSTQETTQEFTIPRADYDLWQRGSRPRLVLEALTSAGQKVTEVVRLDPISGRKAN